MLIVFSLGMLLLWVGFNTTILWIIFVWNKTIKSEAVVKTEEIEFKPKSFEELVDLILNEEVHKKVYEKFSSQPKIEAKYKNQTIPKIKDEEEMFYDSFWGWSNEPYGSYRDISGN